MENMFEGIFVCLFEKGSCYETQNGLTVSIIFLCKHVQCWDYMHDNMPGQSTLAIFNSFTYLWFDRKAINIFKSLSEAMKNDEEHNISMSP